MKFAVSAEQKRFFERHQAIEFGDLLNEYTLGQLKNAIHKSVALRLNIDEPRLQKSTAQQIFTAGHDLWHSHAEIKKWMTGPLLGEILFELLNIRPIRLAYDQLLPSLRAMPFAGAEPETYANLIKNDATIESFSSVQGVAGAVLFCIEAPFAPIEGWPSTAGSALVVGPQFMLPLHELQQHVGALYYTVVFCKDKSVYVLNQIDPHTHSFKQSGYNPGDRLNDKFNPIIFR